MIDGPSLGSFAAKEIARIVLILAGLSAVIFLVVGFVIGRLLS